MDQERQDEQGAFNRTRLEGAITQFINQNTGRVHADPQNGFLLELDKVVKTINESAWELKTARADDEKLGGYAINVPGIELHNPLGYVLGYLATSGGANFDGVGKVIERLGSMPKMGANDSGDYAIHPGDVVRYARFWVNVVRPANAN